MIPEGSKTKICFCDKNKFEKLHDYVHQSQLENKYGGFLKNFEHFWPPLFHLEKSQEIKKAKIKKRQSIIDFCYSFDYLWMIRGLFYAAKCVKK
jgi:hypothetical protein